LADRGDQRRQPARHRPPREGRLLKALALLTKVHRWRASARREFGKVEAAAPPGGACHQQLELAGAGNK
jgi:hypothetical protein